MSGAGSSSEWRWFVEPVLQKNASGQVTRIISVLNSSNGNVHFDPSNVSYSQPVVGFKP
jgi:hypothetical protein